MAALFIRNTLLEATRSESNTLPSEKIFKASPSDFIPDAMRDE